MEKVKIIVDNREKNAELLELLSGKGVELSFAQLPIGDYIVSDRMCIERKTAQDFENSIMNGRLFEQVERMCASFPKPVLLLESQEHEFTLSPNVITGAIAAIFADYNTQVIRSCGVEETATIIEKIAKREQSKEKREPKVVGRKKAYTIPEWQMLMLSSVPGVGPKLARSLLRHFHSIKNVSNASAEDLEKVDKVGEKKAAMLFSVFNEQFKEQE